MFSSTVSERKILRSCGTQPIPARARWSGRICVISRPPRVMVPPNRLLTPTIELISVVLPVPLRARKPSMHNRSGIGGLAEIDRLDARIARHLVRWAFDQQRAVDQHRNPVGE